MIAATITSAYLAVRKCNVSIVNPPSSATTVPTPTLENVTYKNQDLNNGWVRVISDRYHFQIDHPKALVPTTDRNAYYISSQNEAIEVGWGPSSESSPEVNNFVINIIITKMDASIDLESSLDAEVNQALKKNYIASSSAITSVLIGNIQGYTHREYGGAESRTSEIIAYDARLDDKHRISISFERSIIAPQLNGDSIRTQDIPIIQRIVSSFKVLK